MSEEEHTIMEILVNEDVYTCIELMWCPIVIFLTSCQFPQNLQVFLNLFQKETKENVVSSLNQYCFYKEWLLFMNFTG
jgi:hypothetical protein